MAATTSITSQGRERQWPNLHLSIRSVSSNFKSPLHVVRPGDTVTGHVTISSNVDLWFKRVTVSYVGLESSLAVPRWSEDAIFHQFVRFPYHCAVSQSLTLEDGQKLYSNPFAFTVPPGITSANDRASPPCRQFPPSFPAQNPVAWDAQALDVHITYGVHVEVLYEVLTEGGWETKECSLSRPIEFIPYIDVQPPVETLCFPEEFVLRTENTVWSSIFGRKIGSVTVETQEPPPLLYTSDKASTIATMSLKLQIRDDDTYQLRVKAVEIHPVLCTKQFHSKEKLTGTPRVNQATKNGPLKLFRHVLDLDKQVISELQWVRERKEDSNSPPSYQDISASRDRRHIACGAEEIRGPATRPQTAQSSDPAIEQSNGTWSTYFKIPISPPTRLLPSFCANHIAMAYTLIFRVTIVGVHTKRIYLSNPLQVAYPSHEILSNGTVAADGRLPDPVGEPLSTEGEACCVSVASRLDVDHILPEYGDLPR